MSQHSYYSWADLEIAANYFFDFYKSGNYQAVIGIERGGLTLAVMLSHRLGIPFESLKWQTRDTNERDEAKLYSIIKKYNSPFPLIIVDDICDTGTTIDQISKKIAKYEKDNNKIIPVVYCVLINKMQYQSNNIINAGIHSYTNNWVVFPWENHS